MKLTRERLKQIIKEELEEVIQIQEASNSLKLVAVSGPESFRGKRYYIEDIAQGRQLIKWLVQFPLEGGAPNITQEEGPKKQLDDETVKKIRKLVNDAEIAGKGKTSDWIAR